MRKEIYNKIMSLCISTSLIFGSSGFAAVNGTPTTNNLNDSVVCEFNSEVEYFPIGDTKGNAVLTKKEAIRDCVITRTELGECLEWSESTEDRSISPGKYNAYESNNYSDTVGSLLATLGSYDQIEHLWSGWKGYCEIGTKSDFSWAEDPMFWASMVMSAIMSGSQGGDTAAAEQAAETAGAKAVEAGSTDAAIEAAKEKAYKESMDFSTGFLADTAVGETINGAQTYVGEATGALFESAGTGMVTEGAKDAGFEAMTNEVVDTAVDAAYNAAVDQFYNNLGKCLIATGFDISTTLYEFTQDDNSKAPACDPVDEVCGTGLEVSEESEILTMDEVQFEDLVQQFADQEPDSEDLYDYIYVIPPSPENGIVSFRMKQNNEMPTAGLDTAAMDELEEKMKQTKLQISLGISVLSLASCVTVGGGDVATTSAGEDDRATLRKGVGAAINMAANYMGPYGALIGAALKIILYVATSYQSIDTCYDEDDAKEDGLRAERTQKALAFDLCHQVKVVCAEEGPVWDSGCALDGYTYCCYDQIMAKILVEQFKAQLGRDWAHCTGITLRDLNYISFKQCSDSQMTDPATIDGAHQVCGENSDCYDPTAAFQYKYHCIDMTEFMEYLKATTGMEIDMEDFEDFWNDMTEQSPYGATI